MAAAHRLRQGLRALFAFSRPVDYGLALEYLSPPLLRLFRQMRRAEQLHSLNVLRDVRLQERHTPRDLAVAALLHDVGKNRYPLALWQKTLAVLVRAFVPGLARRWSTGDPAHPIRRAFVVYECHPAWGAEAAEQAGASELAVWLIRHHQDDAGRWPDHPAAPLLRRLQKADNTN